MKIQSKIYQEVSVDPEEFIDKLIEKTVGTDRFQTKEADGRFYIETEYHPNRWISKNINKDFYDYVNSLKCVKNYLHKSDEVII